MLPLKKTRRTNTRHEILRAAAAGHHAAPREGMKPAHVIVETLAIRGIERKRRRHFRDRVRTTKQKTAAKHAMEPLPPRSAGEKDSRSVPNGVVHSLLYIYSVFTNRKALENEVFKVLISLYFIGKGTRQRVLFSWKRMAEMVTLGNDRIPMLGVVGLTGRKKF